MSDSFNLASVVSRLVDKAQEVLNRPVFPQLEVRNWNAGAGSAYLRVNLTAEAGSETECLDAEMCLEEWLLDTFGAKRVEPIVLRIVPQDESESSKSSLELVPSLSVA